jgi:hypothetical protein
VVPLKGYSGGSDTNPLRKPERLGGDVLYDADTSKQVSILKDALHLLAKLGKPGTLVSDGRRSCAKRQMWSCLVHTSMGVFLIEICDTSHWRRTRMPAWWGDWGAGKKVLHDFAVRVTSQLISIGAAERCWKAYVHIHCESGSASVQSGLGTALGRSGLRNWSECSITFVCAVSEVVRNMTTCICQ